jgi:succinoglycan biosynthesis transport protein ExoP
VLPGQTYTLKQIVHIARRRWWLILVAFALGTAAGIFAYMWRPVQYRSETLIMVVPQRISDSPVKSRSSMNAETLRSLREQILSRSQLERIIHDLNLYKEQRKSGLMEDAVQNMIGDIDVKLQSNEASFRVTYVNRDPMMAQKVTQRLAALFTGENPRDRENLAGSTNGLLASQLQEAKRRLNDQEKKLEDYRRRYAGQHPSELQGNLQSIQNAQRRLQSLGESTNRARDRRLSIERQIAQAQTPVEVASPGTGVNAPEGAAPPSAAQHETGHARLADLQAELAAVDARLASAQSEEARLKKTMAAYFKKIEMVPARESELVELTRGYGALQEAYSNILEKQDDSKLPGNPEHRLAGEQFRLLDPASRPERPYNQTQRLRILFGAPLGGLAMGLLLVGFLEYRDSSFKTEDDVLRVLSIPVLGLIPVVEAQEEASVGRRPGRRS